MNDLDFDRSSVVQFNQFGAFGLHKNGFRAAVKMDKYRFLATYSYLNYDGYRQHNNEYRNIVNMAMEATLSAHAKLSVLGYFAGGAIKLPGSLTQSEFEKDPLQADPKSVDLDEKRITTKGRIGIRYDATFGRKMNNDIEITAYGAIKNLERAAQDYRIINRYGLGLNARYVNKSLIGARHNELTIGVDLFSQPARTEYYENIHGSKGEQIIQIVSENLANKGFFISDDFEILKEKLFVLLSGRYDNVHFNQAEETLPSRTGSKPYRAFTPKLSLNYKLTPLIAIYTSYSLSFDTPAACEMASPDPEYLMNTDLNPQKSGNFEIGIKGNASRPKRFFFSNLTFEATFFNLRISDEIVPYKMFGDVYYRNAAKANRIGAELGAQAEILRNLDFGISYTWSSFQYLTYNAQTVDTDLTGNIITVNEDFSGNLEPGVPVNNIFISLSYAQPLGKNANIFFRAGYQGISGMYVDDANTDKTKGYSLLNALVGSDLRFGKFNLAASAGINNIFNELYVGFIKINSVNNRFYEAGAPRDYFVSLNLGYTF
jgi:iron complex outermembrane recepter protein